MADRAPYLFPKGAAPGADNVLLHASATRHRVQGYAGPLSIKTVISGRVAWTVGGRELIVDPSSFLVLSAGERYSMDIAAERPVETCCVFFAPGFVEKIALDCTSPLQQSLDAPERLAPALPYLSALHSDSERSLADRVHNLAPRCANMLAPSGFEEDFLQLARALLQFYEQIRAEAARVPATRQATRQELFRRLLIGREYMHAYSSEKLSLTQVARAACLSQFHFHRGFTQAFGETPHAYLTALRLAQARQSIASGGRILDACLAAGFNSPSAFSRLFRARYGQSPSAIRTKFARLGKNSGAIPATLSP